MPSAKLRRLICWLMMGYSTFALADEQSEYTLKAAFLYNFAVYTTWPAPPENSFNLCVYGSDPFGIHLDTLMQKKKVNERTITIQRTNDMKQLDQCQLVFISSSAMSHLTNIVDMLKNKPVLTVADSPGAGEQGVILNMIIKDDKVTFAANLSAAKKIGINLSAQLLRFAIEIN